MRTAHDTVTIRQVDSAPNQRFVGEPFRATRTWNSFRLEYGILYGYRASDWKEHSERMDHLVGKELSSFSFIPPPV
ncbi:translation initiation factor [Pseudozyma hubeiensis SY62]|uniref:Translation initiation factor n=1 Tax=Pseudozyma hubeiensis (strain SY62) TaxID=1305764 RepID=R9PD26_PSEHS|nr:translation initiation factor [Pseudozyma hubeiensis SY62]GAC99259.1 translation initiation factor [Pseudozyma hubeiensis SY62]